jgi:hypothetical protein
MDECPVDKAIDYCYLINSVAADVLVGESEEGWPIEGDLLWESSSRSSHSLRERRRQKQHWWVVIKSTFVRAFFPRRRLHWLGVISQPTLRLLGLGFVSVQKLCIERSPQGPRPGISRRGRRLERGVGRPIEGDLLWEPSSRSSHSLRERRRQEQHWWVVIKSTFVRAFFPRRRLHWFGVMSQPTLRLPF